MQKIVDELKQIVNFKETTDIGDIVLIAAKEPQMLIYARITDIERDPSRRDEWWQVHLTMLSIPPQEMTWTLRTEQMTGQEIFTMGGEERFVKAVEFNSREKPKSKAATGTVKKKSRSLKRVK
ncbi:MAG: hypothetical protein ACN4GW_09300 [Desulforhopalus sp.]